MTAHALIFRLGPSDKQNVTLAVGAKKTEVNLIAARKRLDRGLGGALEWLAARGLEAPEVAVDLLIVAAAVTAADTRVLRTEAQDSWTRELWLSIPVLDPALWSTNAALLERMLGFLTGDIWKFDFRTRPSGTSKLMPIRSALVIKPTCVALFSGGLDSFIGAIDLLEDGQAPLFVSHYWDSDTSSCQVTSLRRLKKQYPNVDYYSLRCRIGFPSNLVAKKASENTLRGRSFLFFAMATLAASAFKSSAPVVVPENGLISLNVPLDPLRLGALSTRTTHPYYMARWNELLKALGLQAKLENPYRFQTKGAMVKGCKNKAFLKASAKDTLSCSHPAGGRFKGESPGHCGRCLPCLIRRAALVAGFGSDPTTYKIHNLTASRLNSEAAEGIDVRSFQLAIARLKARPSSAEFLVRQPGPLVDHSDSDVQKYVQVYRDGMAEVAKVLAGVVTEPS